MKGYINFFYVKTQIPHYACSLYETKEEAEKMSFNNPGFIKTIPVELTPPLDFSRPVCTQRGNPVRILCTVRATHPNSPDKPVFGLVQVMRDNKVEYEFPVSWTKDGRTDSRHPWGRSPYDLVQLED